MASDLRSSRQQAEDGLYDGFQNSIALDDAFVSLIDHPKVFPVVIQLLGVDLRVLTSHLIYKQPDSPETPGTHRRWGLCRDYAIAMDDRGTPRQSGAVRQVRLLPRRSQRAIDGGGGDPLSPGETADPRWRS